MVLNPEVQKRAQEELDTVIGHGRLPGMDDRSRLPYMEAMLLEVLRYHPIGPMGTFTFRGCSASRVRSS
jgi:cytochrome P450